MWQEPARTCRRTTRRPQRAARHAARGTCVGTAEPPRTDAPNTVTKKIVSVILKENSNKLFSTRPHTIRSSSFMTTFCFYWIFDCRLTLPTLDF